MVIVPFVSEDYQQNYAFIAINIIAIHVMNVLIHEHVQQIHKIFQFIIVVHHPPHLQLRYVLNVAKQQINSVNNVEIIIALVSGWGILDVFKRIIQKEIGFIILSSQFLYSRHLLPHPQSLPRLSHSEEQLTVIGSHLQEDQRVVDHKGERRKKVE